MKEQKDQPRADTPIHSYGTPFRLPGAYRRRRSDPFSPWAYLWIAIAIAGGVLGTLAVLGWLFGTIVMYLR